MLLVRYNISCQMFLTVNRVNV